MVGVFHKIGEPNRETFTNSLEQILAYDGVVTFDGVYTSVFDNRLALAAKSPILFISGNQIGREGFCNKEQLLELASLGFKLGWHGWSHDKLTGMTDQQTITELRKPDWINTGLYAYPHGEFDDAAKAQVARMGYHKAYSTTQGNDDNFSLHREYL